MENQFSTHDITSYDIGTPRVTVKMPKGYIAHTDKGIVVCLDSGQRYTCSYQHLVSALKINAYNPDDVQTRNNINDILGKFQSRLNAEIKKVEKRNEEIEQLLNTENNGK